MSDDDAADRAAVEEGLADIRPMVDTMTAGDLAGGGWFARLLRRSLDSYAREVNAEYFRRKYPNLTRDVIADRRVSLAQRYAALAGGMSATAYSVAIAATITTAGGASPVGLPAAVATFAVDLFFVTHLQLRLAHDLSIIYGHPLSLDDPEDLYDLLRVAFGMKAGEAINNAATKLAPEATRVAVKAVASGARLAALKRLPVIGKYLLQRNIVKFAIPLVGVPLSAGINYLSTGSVGRTARRIFRGKAAVREKAGEFVVADRELTPILLQIVLLVARSDGVTSQSEADFAQALADVWVAAGLDPAELADVTRMVHMDEAALFAEVGGLDSGERALVWDAALTAAAVDASVHRSELAVLRRLAPICGETLDADRLRTEALRYG